MMFGADPADPPPAPASARATDPRRGSGAIELARLAALDGSVGELAIGVLEKAGGLGEHSLSGAVVNPRAFRELFPDVPEAELPFRQRVDGEEVRFLTRN